MAMIKQELVQDGHDGRVPSGLATAAFLKSHVSIVQLGKHNPG